MAETLMTAPGVGGADDGRGDGAGVLDGGGGGGAGAPDGGGGESARARDDGGEGARARDDGGGDGARARDDGGGNDTKARDDGGGDDTKARDDGGHPDGAGRRHVDDGGAGGLTDQHRSRYVPPRAPRAGEPWTDADYEQILAAVRDGVTDIDAIAARLGRSRQPTVSKARRLLPVAERTAPVDRVLRLLREHQEDPGYDWQRVTLEDPPPPPVVRPPALTGLPGLTSEDLVAIGYAIGLAGTAGSADLVARVADELQHRGLLGELIEYRTERMLRQPGAEITWTCAAADAVAWLRRAFPSTRGAFYAHPHDDPGPDYW